MRVNAHRLPHSLAMAPTPVEEHNRKEPLPSRVATFLRLFRTTLPELFTYFEEEEVDVVGFASNWLQDMLANELQLNDLMRLWGEWDRPWPLGRWRPLLLTPTIPTSRHVLLSARPAGPAPLRLHRDPDEQPRLARRARSVRDEAHGGESATAGRGSGDQRRHEHSDQPSAKPAVREVVSGRVGSRRDAPRKAVKTHVAYSI